jgi:L-arginine dehydrogenase
MTSASPLVLDAAAVERLLPRLDVREAMRSLFRALGSGKAVQPAQTLTLLPQDRGDFILYSGALAEAGVFGAKLSPYIPADGRAIVTAWTLLMSSRTGQPLLLCDSGRLTTERTAATTALAVDLLAPSSAKDLAILGSGPVARAHLRAILDLRPWSRIRIFSPRLQGDAQRQAALRADPRVSVAASARDCVEGADVVVLATSSGTPVIDPAWLGPETLVTSISTNAALAHEVPPAFLLAAQVYCDNAATTPDSAGDMVIARRDHGWTAVAIRGDLAGLCCGTCPLPERGRPVFFRSIGLGLEDVAIAHALWAAAREEGETA